MKNAFAIASASTKPFAGHSISYSPFYKSKFAIACAANYGLYYIFKASKLKI